MQTFTTPEPITATVQVAGARVRVTASDRTDTIVRVEPVDRTNRSHIKVADRTKVELADGHLTVKTTRSGDQDGSVAITIDLPTGSELVAYLATSTVHAGGVLGDCELHLGSGRAELDRIGALRANVSAGEVEIGHVDGAVVIDGREVEARIGEVAGSVALSTVGGRTWIGHASTDLDLRSGKGSFDIERADRSVTAEVGSGAIRIGRVSSGRVKLRNGSGDIEVGIGADTVVSLDLDSERGAVHDLVPSRGSAGASGSEVMVHARTRHGDVIARRAED